MTHDIGCGIVTPGTKTSDVTKDYGYQARLMTIDEHCYECKVRYRDPKPRDLVMYLHALKYSVSNNFVYISYL